MRPLTERFWSRVLRAGDDECWIWTGTSSARGGYGLMPVNGRSTRVPRIAWELHNGVIPSGMCVLHRCDNPKCVNPGHLFLGTHHDNALDRKLKERTFAKLTHVQAATIRSEVEAGATQTSVAKRYAVSVRTIYRIVHRVAKGGHS